MTSYSHQNDSHQNDAHLSDGLLLMRAPAGTRSSFGVVDDRDDIYLLQDVADPDAAPAASAVVRRLGADATVCELTGPPELLSRLVAEICDALRANGVATLSAGRQLPVDLANPAGLTDPISL